jgi:very-short-patch-repair endonuclease
MLPGVYADAEHGDDPLVRMRAVALWDPDAVITGATAARVTFWPAVRVGQVGVSTRRRPSLTPGFSCARRRIPPELILDVQGLRLTHPALTALDLCATVGGDGLDEVLPTRAARLSDLQRARELTRHRRGSAAVQRLLDESRNEPWSAAERRLHRMLHEAGISGWTANHRVCTGSLTYYLDIAFARERLGLEVDGRRHHDDAAVFEADRWRQNWLVLAGWRIIRFTWSMLTEHPAQVILTVREALTLPQPSVGGQLRRLHRLEALSERERAH